MIQVNDEVGNPFPPGILVAVADTAGNAIGAAYTIYGGSANITVQGAIPYVASFSGVQAPTFAFRFFGSALPGATTTLNVTGYRSPTLSGAGYTQMIMQPLFPKRRVSGAARLIGGGWYAIATIFGAAAGLLDSQTQQLRGALRAQTAQGADLDSWAADFFGSNLPRYAGEPDTVYLSRITAALGPRCTLAAIEQLVNQFYAATLASRIAAGQINLAYDVAGSYDQRGGYDTYIPPALPQTLTPTVKVWDSWTLPALAAQYGVYSPQFVIQIGFTGAAKGWSLDFSSLDISTSLTDSKFVLTSTTAPDARLGALVNLVKSAGKQPLYQTYSS